jgi:hypothetical protein
MKKLTMFVTGFAVVLVAGVATAQIGMWEAPTVDEFSAERPATALNQPEDDAAAEELAALEDAAREAEKKEAEKKAQEEQAAAERQAAELAAKEAAEKETATEVVAEEQKEPEKEQPADTTPPDIVILHPKDGQVFEDAKVAFEGKTEPGARVFAGEYEADVDAEGNWRIVLILSPGPNTATLYAKDAAGNKASASVKAILETPAKEAVFTANQKFGATSTGYEKFYGTGTPGTKITVSSNHGSAAAEVNKYGEWLVKLWFEAEPGTVFVATVKDSFGHSKAFEVKVLAQEIKPFTANQKYGSCSENPPYDKFYGTGKPGTVVEIFSEFGSGRTTIGSDGWWNVKVVFEGAPYGQPFDVILETSEGHRMVFGFTALEPGTEK